MQTPYTVLAGSTFGDYQNKENVAQAMLFGEHSKIQAITTELSPHYGYPRLLRIWPSGRVSLGNEVELSVIFENLKPVLVFSEQREEFGRLYVNLKDLDFRVVGSPLGGYTWSKKDGEGKSILVPYKAGYVSRASKTGDLFSTDGQRLMTFDQGQVVFHDELIKTEVFDEGGDFLKFEFSLGNEILADWYVHLDLDKVENKVSGSLRWEFSQEEGGKYALEEFYAGEGVLDEKGLAVIKKTEKNRYSLGQGRDALDDVRDNNGEGWKDQDKIALSFLAGNTVGESSLLQSEGIINLGDPVISLRMLRITTNSLE